MFANWFSAPRDPDLDATVAWVIDAVEPVLSQLSGYPQKYAACIGHALRYCEDLVRQMPPPVLVSRQSFTLEPMVHALFGSPDSITQTLVRSQSVHEWLQKNPGSQEVFGLMGVRMNEKAILGVDIQHGQIRHDVPQKVTHFSDHTFSSLAATLEETQEMLTRQFLASLLERVKDRVEDGRQRVEYLEQAVTELQTRLRQHPQDPALQAGLEQKRAELGKAVSVMDLNKYSAHLEAVLFSPEQYLQVKTHAITADAMGICRMGDSDCAQQQLMLREMKCRDRRRWVVMPVHCRLDEMPTYHERLDEVGRWLSF